MKDKTITITVGERGVTVTNDFDGDVIAVLSNLGLGVKAACETASSITGEPFDVGLSAINRVARLSVPGVVAAQMGGSGE